MNTLTLDDLIKKLEEYNPDAIPAVEKAYKYAEFLHDGQYRQSGEPYIIHPLNVAYILSELYADQDTICAGLLHDTLEDTNTSKEEIATEFNKEVAKLVEGVTKISNMPLATKQEQMNANTRKIVTSIMEDVRIVIIKLADRLHNMRTLQYKSEEKQKEKSLETLNTFVPLSYYIGAYRIRNELEDICLSYLKPDEYKKIDELRTNIEIESKDCLNEMVSKIKVLLDDKNIPNEIKIRIKNVYGIYRKIKGGHKIEEVHDLLILKLIVDSIDNCYRTLGAVHSQYNPINDKFKDYIYNPKTNMYSSIHTTVFAPDDRLVQMQIRTFDMDKVASFGLTTYWNIKKGQARYDMQEDLKDKYQFFNSLKQLDNMFVDNEEFITHLNGELFGNNIYVYTSKGRPIELPEGSTPIDFAYQLHEELGNTMIGARVNNEPVDVAHELKNGDRVIILNDTSSKPKLDWLDKVKTSKAKSKILEYTNKK